MKLRDLLANEKLKNKHVLKMLLMHHCGFTKEEFVTKVDEEVADDKVEIVQKDYWRYVNDKEPLEYIMGYVEFDQRRLYVDRNTMIPRRETEYMIQACKEELSRLKDKNKTNLKNEGQSLGKMLVVDVGTGCGVLGLSTFLADPDYVDQLYLTDYYPECLITAKKNTENLLSVEQQEKVEFSHSNLLSHLFENQLVNKNDSLLVTANLPYIPTETFDTQAEDNVIKWEPRYAFISGKDGLDLYREMFAQVKAYESLPDQFVMFLEMMTWQVDILRNEFPWMEFEEVKTFHFQIRIVRATLQ